MEERKTALDGVKEKSDGPFEGKSLKRLCVISISVAAVILIIAAVCSAYLNDFYPADGEQISAYMEDMPEIEAYFSTEGVSYFKPKEGSEVGIIFYPGGKVEAEAYFPLMVALASRGITAALCEMPFNLAVLDQNAADGVAEMLPEVKEWYIGGHSLGGSMAASYLDSHPEIKGLILLGSYSTADVSDKRVISVYGSEDGVMNREKYEKYKSNLPDDLTEVVIDGGNHAYFGMYGEQDGDGEARIDQKTQIGITAGSIAQFIKEN